LLVSHFAVALARSGSSWSGAEIDLEDVEDVDGLVEVAAAEVGDGNDTLLIAVEEDDEWLALVRVDGEPSDARVFLSDTRVLATSDIAAIFADAIEGGVAAEPDDADEEADDSDDDDSGGLIDAEPGGDAGLLADIGTPAPALLALCAEEGALPGDVTAAICERAGCAEVYDSLRTA
jgi:putative tRNA adenosine deaminase-associated protein